MRQQVAQGLLTFELQNGQNSYLKLLSSIVKPIQTLSKQDCKMENPTLLFAAQGRRYEVEVLESICDFGTVSETLFIAEYRLYEAMPDEEQPEVKVNCIGFRSWGEFWKHHTTNVDPETWMITEPSYIAPHLSKQLEKEVESVARQNSFYKGTRYQQAWAMACTPLKKLAS